MARPLRLEFPGALYHVTSRGDRQESTYEDDSDRDRFLSLLDDVSSRFNWLCPAYCLMDNHYHLLIETPEANLSKGMRQLNGVYTQCFNRAHSRSGHVFQGRYKAILVEKDSYLIELACYVVLNPVRAGMVRAAKDWRWSSYRATTGQASGPVCLVTDWMLSNFGKRKSVAVDRYKLFVAEGKGQPSPWGNVRNQLYLGSKQFIEEMQELIDGEKDLSEIPAAQIRAPVKSLDDITKYNEDRNSAIVEAYASGGYTLKQLGDYFGLHYSTVGGILSDHKS